MSRIIFTPFSLKDEIKRKTVLGEATAAPPGVGPRATTMRAEFRNGAEVT